MNSYEQFISKTLFAFIWKILVCSVTFDLEIPVLPFDLLFGRSIQLQMRVNLHDVQSMSLQCSATHLIRSFGLTIAL